LIIPPYLKAGATIGITCPAGYLPVEKARVCAAVLQAQGYRVQLGATIGSGEYYFAGTDAVRRQDLQQMLDNPEIDAILMGRGGYGVSRIIDDLDFTKFAKKPKWIWGFSDITVLHSHIQKQLGIATLHASMCAAFTPETIALPFVQATLAALGGAPLSYTVPPAGLNRAGRTKGILTGGNLALLAHLTGSPSQVDTAGKILFLEDIGEYRYNIDRLLLNLKRSGQLSKLAGIVIGEFTDTQDTERPFGQELEGLILDKVAEYNYPVLSGLPCGHGPINFPLKLGVEYALEVTAAGGRLFEVSPTTVV
jgi:muramoyltetrapeptide carboxypeptidase